MALFWGAVEPINFELEIKVGVVSKSAYAYNSLAVSFRTPEIFEFKVAYLTLKKSKDGHVRMTCLSHMASVIVTRSWTRKNGQAKTCQIHSILIC